MPTSLTRCTPESVGIPSAALQAFITAVEARVGGLHSLMLLRHGQVAAEAWWAPYAPERPHMLFSLSKTFTSTAVGLAVTEGLLTRGRSGALASFRTRRRRRVSRNLAAMRVRHLLSMNTGHDEDTTGAMSRGATATGRAPFSRCRSSTSPAPIFSTTPAPPTCSRPSCSG